MSKNSLPSIYFCKGAIVWLALTYKAKRGNEALTASDSSAMLVEGEGLWPGARTVAGVALLYVACIAIATYPMITQLGSRIPSLGDRKSVV